DWETLLKAHKAKADGGDKKSEEDAKASAPPKAEASQAQPEEAKQAGDGADSDGRVKASPLARSMAKEKGYDISKIPGTGDFGRVIKRDVENYKPSAAPAGEAKD